MKTALVLCGFMRNWKDNYLSVKKEILEYYKPDVFISSYTYSKWFWTSTPTKVNIDEVINVYKPKNYIFREYEDCPIIKFKNNNSESIGRDYSIRQLYEWYTNKLSINLFDFLEYDVIIKLRTDISISNFKIDFTKDLVIPKWKYHPGSCNPKNAYVDHIAYGKSKYMKEYFCLYDKIEEMHHNKIDISLGETLLKNYLDNYLTTKVHLEESIDWMLRDGMWASEKGRIFPITPATEMDE